MTVTIDSMRFAIPERTNMIDAARKIGIYIANYCYLPILRAFGACRMCVVENKGRHGRARSLPALGNSGTYSLQVAAGGVDVDPTPLTPRVRR